MILKSGSDLESIHNFCDIISLKQFIIEIVVFFLVPFLSGDLYGFVGSFKVYNLKTHHFSVLLSPPKCGFKKNDLESHDIAIVELETNIDLTGRVSEHKLIGPICLPKQGEV